MYFSTFLATLLPPTSDTRLTSAHLTNYSLTTHRSALSQRRALSGKSNNWDTRQETRSPHGGGIWPPPVPMPVKTTNHSDQGIYFLKSENLPDPTFVIIWRGKLHYEYICTGLLSQQRCNSL